MTRSTTPGWTSNPTEDVTRDQDSTLRCPLALQGFYIAKRWRNGLQGKMEGTMPKQMLSSFLTSLSRVQAQATGAAWLSRTRSNK